MKREAPCHNLSHISTGFYAFYFVLCVFACMYVCAPHVCLVPSKVKRDLEFLGLELWMVEPPRQFWEPNQGAWQEQQVLLTTESLLQLFSSLEAAAKARSLADSQSNHCLQSSSTIVYLPPLTAFRALLLLSTSPKSTQLVPLEEASSSRSF